jgi:hypothetical protein
MNKEELDKKNKEGLANIILMVGVCLIVVGIIVGFTNPPDNFGKAFFVCGAGTILSFVANYMKNGYLKFFN